MKELDRIDTLVEKLNYLSKTKTELIDEYAYAKKAEIIKSKHGFYYTLHPMKDRKDFFLLFRDDGVLEIDGTQHKIRKWCERKSIHIDQILRPV